MSRFLNLICRHARVAGPIAGLWLAPALASAKAEVSSLPLLTNAAQVHQLPQSEAKRGYPVRLRGVTTFYHSLQNEFFLQDETGGVLVHVHHPSGFEPGVGQLLQVEGTTHPGVPSAEVRSAGVVLIGEGPLPPACRVTEEQLAAGQPDGSWVEIHGVVRAVRVGRADALLGLEIATRRHRVLALLKHYDLQDCRRLVDAEVRVIGVLRRIADRQLCVMVPWMGDITVVRPAPADPFAQPLLAVAALPGLGLTAEPVHRSKVAGVVTLHQPGLAVFIQEGTNSLSASTEDRTPLQPGDVIELIGFPAATRLGMPTLENASFRKLHAGAAPTPLPISVDQGAHAALDAHLVTLEGVLLGWDGAAARLRMRSSDIHFHARLADTTGDFSGSLREGSLLRLTGVCLAGPQSTHTQTEFELLLRSPADVAMLAGSPIPRGGRALWALAAVALGVLLLLGGRMALRRRAACRGSRL